MLHISEPSLQQHVCIRGQYGIAYWLMISFICLNGIRKMVQRQRKSTFLTRLSRMEFSTRMNETSPFPF